MGEFRTTILPLLTFTCYVVSSYAKTRFCPGLSEGIKGVYYIYTGLCGGLIGLDLG